MQFTSKFLLRKKLSKKGSRQLNYYFFAVFVYFSFSFFFFFAKMFNHKSSLMKIKHKIRFSELSKKKNYSKNSYNIFDLLSKGPDSPKSIIFRVTTSSNHSTRSGKIQLLDRECRSRFTKIMSCTNSVVSFQQANVSSGFRSF